MSYSSFLPKVCDPDHLRVGVSLYDISPSGRTYTFLVESSSRPGLHHTVEVYIENPGMFKSQVSHHASPKTLLLGGHIKVWSDDEWFTFGGCNYWLTYNNASIYPEYRIPTLPSHNTLCSHTLYAALTYLSYNFLKTTTLKFSNKVNFCWNNVLQEYVLDPKV